MQATPSEASSQLRASFWGRIWELTTTHITLRIDLKHIYHVTKKNIIFIFRTYFRDEPARPDPAITLFDDFVLKCVKIYEFKAFTQDLN